MRTGKQRNRGILIMMAFVLFLSLMTIAPKLWIKTREDRRYLWRRVQSLANMTNDRPISVLPVLSRLRGVKIPDRASPMVDGFQANTQLVMNDTSRESSLASHVFAMETKAARLSTDGNESEKSSTPLSNFSGMDTGAPDADGDHDSTDAQLSSRSPGPMAEALRGSLVNSQAREIENADKVANLEKRGGDKHPSNDTLATSTPQATGNMLESSPKAIAVAPPVNNSNETVTRKASGGGRGRAKQKQVVAPQNEPDNPTIPICNVPDVSAVPNAYPHLEGSVSAPDMVLKGGCEYWAVNRNNATLKVLMRGRMANGMLQYLWTRIKADSNGWGLSVMNAKTFSGSEWTSPVSHYKRAHFGHIESAPIAQVNMFGCGPHFQSYVYYQHERCTAQCIFAKRDAFNSSHYAFQALGPNDVVIHFREPIELINEEMNKERIAHNNTVPPYSYYEKILLQLKANGTLGQVWIAAAHDFSMFPTFFRPSMEVPRQLEAEFGARLVKGSSEQDHYLCRQAPIFIGSFGTYSWTAAYLSVGRQIHLPYDSSEKSGSTWNRWSQLFIHDDPRIFYHDAFGNASFQSAAQVMESDTKFSFGLRRRAKVAGHCDPRLVEPPQKVVTNTTQQRMGRFSLMQ